MAGPMDYAAILNDPFFRMNPQAAQQALMALGPYAGPAGAAMATAGALVPPIAYAANPGVRQDMNAAMASDLGMLGGMGRQALENYTLPGLLMQARRSAAQQALPIPTEQPRGAATPRAGNAPPRVTPTTAPRGAATPAPATPQANPLPTPPQFPGGPQRNIAKGLSLLGAASMARPLIYGEVGGALPAMGQRMGQDAQAVGSAMQQAATGGNPLVRMYARPMAGMMATPQATTAPTPSMTPTPGMTGAPTNTPTSAASPTSTFPTGYQQEYNGELYTKVEGGWNIAPMPSGGQARR